MLMKGQAAGQGLHGDLNLPRVVTCDGRLQHVRAPRYQGRRLLHQAAAGRDCQTSSDAPSTSVSTGTLLTCMMLMHYRDL